MTSARALMQVGRLFTALVLITVFAACSYFPFGRNTNDPAPQPGKFKTDERVQLVTEPQNSFTVIYLTDIGGSQKLASTIKSSGGKVRFASEKSGIVLAKMTGKIALEVEQKNAALGSQSPARMMSLDKRNTFDFKAERLHPHTGLDNDVNRIVLDPNFNNHQLPTAEMGVFEFESLVKSRYGVQPNGDKITIAILDTGVDIAHKDVFQDRIKISRDSTGEGEVVLEKAVLDAATKKLSAPSRAGKVFELAPSQISPKSEYFLGVLSEKNFVDTESIGDIDQDGKADRDFDVLLTRTPEGFRAVIDVNGDSSFADEKSIANFESTRDTVAMDQHRSGLVLMNVNIPLDEAGELLPDEDGQLTINLAGFDSGQHGTHVAGIAAGRFDGPQFAGKFRGGAPYAQILAFKVLGKNGGADADIIEAIGRATDAGAHVINMSLGSLRRPTDGLDTLSKTIDQVIRRTSVIFTISAGNDGVGMNSVGSPSNADRAISVGASVTGDTWRKAYNIPLAPLGNFVWSFSGTGPTDTGEVRPTILAPGSAFSSIPLARPKSDFANSGYDVFQGTSMAAPAAAGAIALLLDAVEKINASQPQPVLVSTSSQIVRSLIDGAKDINELNFGIPNAPKYQRIEQGAGLLNLVSAFESLSKRKIEGQIDYEIRTTSTRASYEKSAKGIYTTVIPEQKISFTVRKTPLLVPADDEHNFYREMALFTSAPWVQFESDRIAVAGVNRTAVNLNIDQSYLRNLPYGVHEARIFARNAENGQLEFVFDITYVKSKELNHLNDRSEVLNVGLTLNPGAVQRHFFYVSPDRSRISLALSTPVYNSDGSLTDARVRLAVYDPTGANVLESDYVRGRLPMIEFSKLNPIPGVWEVVLYKSFGATELAPVTLKISAESLLINPPFWTEDMGTTGRVVEKSFRMTNYGRDITPTFAVKADRFATWLPDVLLANKGKSEVLVKIPAGIGNLIVRTDEVKGNIGADVDLRLFDSSGALIGTSGGGTAQERIVAKVKPGDTVRLEIDSYDLGEEEKGVIDVHWEFILPQILVGEVDARSAPLGGGRSMGFTARLDLQPVPMSIVQELKATFSEVRLKGIVGVFDQAISDERLVSAIPLEVSL